MQSGALALSHLERLAQMLVVARSACHEVRCFSVHIADDVKRMCTVHTCTTPYGALCQLLKRAAPCSAQQLLVCGSHAPWATRTASSENTKPLSNANTAVVQRTHLKQLRLHGLAAAFLGLWLPVRMGWLLVWSVASLWRRASLQGYPALASRCLNRSSWIGMT